MNWRNRRIARHYLRRAKQFRDAGRFLLDDLDAYGDVVAVAAVHGAIALADAILEGFGDGRSKDQDHKTAARRLKMLCKRHQIEPAGIQHFAKLVEQKNHFSYGDQRLDYNRIKAAITHLDRFTDWANRKFPLLAEESSDDAQSP